MHRLEKLTDRPTYHIASFYASRGDGPRAIAWVDSTYAEGSDWITLIALAPNFDAIRAHPRVTAVLKKLGMENVHPR